MITVSDVLKADQPDPDGHRIPSHIRRGSMVLSGVSDITDKINVGVSVGIFNTKTATCGNTCPTCFGYSSFFLTPSRNVIANGSTGSYQGMALGQDGRNHLVAPASWSSTNTSVATSQGSGNYLGVSPGNFGADAFISLTDVNGDCAGNGSPCPNTQFVGMGPGTVVPTVSFSSTPVVPLGGSGTITATVAPTNNTTTILLSLVTTNGTGQALFANNGKNTLNITATTSLIITGVQASSTPDNIQLTATLSSVVLATTTLTVGATNGAIPVNFRQVGVSQLSNGVLQFVYEWDSSSGTTSDLASCTVGEIVTYPGSGSTYLWTSPPYSNSDPNTNYSNPFTSGVAATNFLVPPYNHIGFGDQHEHPAFLLPYRADNFTATQYYRFQCPNYRANAWINFTGPIPIQRTVSQNTNSTWKYTITKSGSSNSVNPLP